MPSSSTIMSDSPLHFDHTEVEFLNASLRLTTPHERKCLVLLARAQQGPRFVSDGEQDALTRLAHRPLQPFLHRCARAVVDANETLPMSDQKRVLREAFSNRRYIDLDAPVGFEVEILNYDDPVYSPPVDMSNLAPFERVFSL
jgi:hypothetical protein